MVTIRNVNASVILDGFIIESGRANGAGANLDRGGGLLIEDAWPIIFDCTFLRNRAIEGGGVAVISVQQAIGNVIPLLLNCRFNGNVVEADGGGLHAFAARPVLANCTFAGNSAAPAANGQGGGVFSRGDGGEVMLVNCTLAGNEADLGGGVAGTPADPGDAGSLGSDVTLVNSVVFGNVGGESFGPVSATTSCIPGVPGPGNIAADPLYESAPFIGDDDAWGTFDDDYGDLRLRVGLVPPAPSPCIDTGLNVALVSIMDVLDLDGDQNFTEPIPWDIRRAARFAFHAAILPPDPCLNVVAVDMGAFENSDCDGDGVRDENQTDTNADGIADLCQDCNGNGVPDPVDLAGPNHVDCNGNGIPDYCDLINQCMADDNGNCVPNQCECTPGVIDLVFVIDTSGSQTGELSDICSMAAAVVSLFAAGNDLNAAYVGITDEAICAAIADDVATVSELVGGNTTVPDTAAACGPGTCTQPLTDESWGPALAIVAERNAWRPGARRIIVAVFDEAACDGDEGIICDLDDNWALCNARTFLLSNQVIAIPVTGIDGTEEQCVVDEAEALAATFSSSVALHRDLFDSYNGETGPPMGTRVADALLAAVNTVAASCTPVQECPWDIDGDCHAGILDFLALLGAWGDNPGHPADFDGDGVVGIVDFLALLGHWGPCPGVDAQTSGSLQSVVEGAGLIWPSDWDAFEATMTDPNASDAEKDRWACWMDHYLDVHSRPFFIDWTVPCPAPDPFGGH